MSESKLIPAPPTEAQLGTLLGIAANIRDSARCLIEAPAVAEDIDCISEAMYIEQQAERAMRMLTGKEAAS